MTRVTDTTRPRLTADRVLDGAVALADRIGVHELTIRRLATELGVKPMTIYHHVDGKEAILDGIVDRVFAEIELPDPALDWRSAMRARCCSARAVLARHPWAAAMMESRRSPGEATLTHHDAVLACLRRSMSLPMTAHAYALLDAYVYGFALQEAALPATGGEEMNELATDITAGFDPGRYPALTEFVADHATRPGYDFGDEFEFGLDLVLDGLALTIGAESADTD